jgi:hypothetical protein
MALPLGARGFTAMADALATAWGLVAYKPRIDLADFSS